MASFEKLDHKDLYTLGTVLVDYRGYRVVCQTIIPGLLQREHDSAVVYGSIDTGRNVCVEERFIKLVSGGVRGTPCCEGCSALAP